ncbi:L-type lectin-domain containing receptor kinase IX.1-like [Gossypium arboreum]|nr:L-type lectin-domain containing receptor kinase IX.1-like [Gossypium arboreum]
MLLLLFLYAFLDQASSTSLIDPHTFSFPSFDPNSCINGSLICMGSVTAGNGYLSLTPEPNNNSTSPLEKVGRVLFHQQVVAWPASFSTTFTIRISPFPNSNVSGDGMAFIFAQDNASSPPSSTGSYLGIMDPSTQGGVVQQLAVELDTYKNEWDPDANHIGIDTISIINPVAAESLNATGIDLKSGRNIKVRIDYHGWKKLLEISMAYSGDMLVRVLNHSIEMEDTVPSSVFVGFTAATGRVPESHHVLDWTFSTIPLPDLNNHGSKYFKMKTILLIVVPLIMGLLIVLICFLPSFRRLVKRKKEMVKKKVDIEIRSRTAANVPKMFTHKMLAKATHNFSKENLLGTGGFGSVYKGTLKDDPPTIVAVKKISATSKQGEKEYFAEICTIGRLRHKNIVQLQGWCHEGEHHLLVYEYMPNGSLDRYFGKKFLDWDTRFKILTGLASALLYLHEDSSNPVVHRDVKPNNVMLDEEFNAHLGDFGLARLLQNDDSVTTMLAGTPGYLAPEVGFTGKSTPESDVYSFGMVVIEVVCGRRSKGIMDENSLVDYVWNSYGQNELLNCVDPKLESEFDEEQVKRTLIVGLACLHPDSTQRPKIRKVVQIFLNPDEPLMDLPESRPSAVYITVSSSGSTTTTNIESKSAPQLPSLDSSKADDVVLQCDF